MHNGFGDNHARNSSTSGSNFYSSSSGVHGSLISFAWMGRYLSKTSSSWISSSYFWEIFSWISCSSMEFLDVDLSLVASLSLDQGCKNILVVVCPPLFNKFFRILLSMISCFSIHHRHGGLMHVNPMDECKLILYFLFFFLIKLKIYPNTILAPPWKWHQKEL